MSAVISPDGVYRYELRRLIGGKGVKPCCFIMLNPSTADAEKDDPTIRRCIGYARAWESSALIVVNLFAFRATNPKDLFAAIDPVGPENKSYIQAVAKEAGTIVCAWGTHGDYLGQGLYVLRLLDDIGAHPLALAKTKNGHPAHPLYLPKHLSPFDWRHT